MKHLALTTLLLLVCLTACDLAGGLASLSEKEVTLPAFSTEEPTEILASSAIPPETIPSITASSSSSAEPDLPAETAPVTEDALRLLFLTETVKRGEMATVTLRGIPGQTYVITVHYPSSVSTASGLEPKIADENGEVSWSWRIGSRTSEGSHRIVIEGAGQTLTLTFTVTA